MQQEADAQWWSRGLARRLVFNPQHHTVRMPTASRRLSCEHKWGIPCSWIEVHLLCSLSSALSILITRDELRSMIWAGFRFWSNRDSLLRKKTRSVLTALKGWTPLTFIHTYDLISCYNEHSHPSCVQGIRPVSHQLFPETHLSNQHFASYGGKGTRLLLDIWVKVFIKSCLRCLKVQHYVRVCGNAHSGTSVSLVKQQSLPTFSLSPHTQTNARKK